MAQRKEKPEVPKNQIAPLEPLRSPKTGSIDEKIRAFMDELIPEDFIPGLSTNRVKQLQLLLSYIPELSRDEIREFIYPYMYEMFLKGYSAPEIAMALDMNVSTVKTWIADLRQCFKDTITGFDPDLELGKTVKFYDIISQKCLDMADREGGSSNHYRLAIQAQAEKTRMLYELGFYDLMKARAIAGDDAKSDSKTQMDKDIDEVLDVIYTVKSLED